MARYVSFSNSIRANGDRHASNAKRHLENGHADYAAGSMVKAHRNWKRADEFDEWMRPKTRLEAEIRERLSKAVAETLFSVG